MQELFEEQSKKSFLLIGNSRWHWAFKNKKVWEFLDTPINNLLPEYPKETLLAWASVGKIPTSFYLDQFPQLQLKDIPLLNVPPWLGVDRALAGWGAFQKAQKLSSMSTNGLLIADAGTVLSLTKISSHGKFEGGQLAAGLNLQLKAMSEGTQNLKYPSKTNYTKRKFPQSTDESMLRGSLESLIGMIKQAKEDSAGTLWICGGDAPIIFHALQERNVEVFHHPNLVLEGMIDLKS